MPGIHAVDVARLRFDHRLVFPGEDFIEHADASLSGSRKGKNPRSLRDYCAM
jgi:hypothetical protein